MHILRIVILYRDLDASARLMYLACTVCDVKVLLRRDRLSVNLQAEGKAEVSPRWRRCRRRSWPAGRFAQRRTAPQARPSALFNRRAPRPRVTTAVSTQLVDLAAWAAVSCAVCLSTKLSVCLSVGIPPTTSKGFPRKLEWTPYVARM